jgi:CheY-like chemotaxis protein
MRIINHDAAPVFASIVEAMAIDPSSWDKWLVLHLAIEPRGVDCLNQQSYAYVMHEISHQLKAIDGTAYMCDDYTIFMLCRNISSADLYKQGHDISYGMLQHYDLKSAVELYHPSSEWRQLIALCRENNYISKAMPSLDYNENPLHQVVMTMGDIYAVNQLQKRADMPLKIMLVEDDPLARRIVSNCIKDSQYLVTAGTAHEAITHYMIHSPDIIFLDIGLPDYDGFTVLNAIKAHDKDAYIVMFSGKNYEDYIAYSLQAGASGFVEKPFRKERLYHYIDDYKQLHAM